MHKLLLVPIEFFFTSVKNKISKKIKNEVTNLIMGKMPTGTSMKIYPE
jgi:hypothetical protein